MIFETSELKKEYTFFTNGVAKITYTNKLTNKIIEVVNPNEFVIGFNIVTFWIGIEYFKMSNCKLISADKTGIKFLYTDGLSREWRVNLKNIVDENVIKTYVEVNCLDEDVYLDSVEYMNFNVDNDNFSWSRPDAPEKAQIPKYWTTLGQPVYYNSFFMAVEFPSADNKIVEKKISLKHYIGRKMADFHKNYVAHNYVLGSAIGCDMLAHKKSFFDYIKTFARPAKFRLQFNSWYDNQLNINSENIKEVFTAVHDGFVNHGLRDIDCYVVDDGWVDYKKTEFWAFNTRKFPNEFKLESELTQKFNSTFGVWFGPRGGYTESFAYAKKLAKIGYKVNSKGREICVADPKYISDLADRMIYFMQNYNVSYFKIDGFAISNCNSKKHGHPVGGYQNLYFYTYQWEQWFIAFEKMRKVKSDVFLNITSHSNNSPFMLKHADAVWLNNASDMYYEGEGSNLDQCLNYRDGRYNNFYNIRGLQFPSAYLYNHEPCYGIRNFNPPAPSPWGKLVEYTEFEFEKYLFMCMMRGTGFVELYYSPSMFNDKLWDVNAKVLTWAEANFNILRNSIYFGGVPKKGEVYGYFAYHNDEAIVAFRNPSSIKQTLVLNSKNYSHTDSNFDINEIYGDKENIEVDNAEITVTLKPYEVKIIRLNYKQK